ncbi:MAG: protein containing YkuD domain [Verrucomicrobiaceae bacterium]|nr:protein containing YkuD domain [Verrucomicrobiaceae bacterium]
MAEYLCMNPRPLCLALLFGILAPGCKPPASAQTMPAATSTDAAPANWQELKPEQRLADLHRRRLKGLKNDLHAAGFKLGSPAYLRIFKESSELELWLQKPGATNYEKWKTYPIARWSGNLGPKQKEGDYQAPEGFYNVVPKRLNPASKYHLSFNIGYPNAYDTAHHRSGNLIMVHGKNVSIGCYAMTDPGIEEIYLIVEAALPDGQTEVPVHCFPFRMTEERMAQAKTDSSPWLGFWNELRPAYLAFEAAHVPPVVRQGMRYIVAQ